MNKRIVYSLVILSCALLAPAGAVEKTCCDAAVCEHESTSPERFQTVQEVVDYIMSVAPPQHLQTLKQHSQSKFLGMYFKLDKEFDERLALKDGNQALLDDAGAKSHRRAWRTIRIAFWKALQELE